MKLLLEFIFWSGSKIFNWSVYPGGIRVFARKHKKRIKKKKNSHHDKVLLYIYIYICMYVCMYDSTSNAEEFNGQFKMALGFYVVVSEILIADYCSLLNK